jgi:hypothetical protein
MSDSTIWLNGHAFCAACGEVLGLEEQDWGCFACGGEGFDEDSDEDDHAYAPEDFGCREHQPKKDDER